MMHALPVLCSNRGCIALCSCRDQTMNLALQHYRVSMPLDRVGQKLLLPGAIGPLHLRHQHPRWQDKPRPLPHGDHVRNQRQCGVGATTYQAPLQTSSDQAKTSQLVGQTTLPELMRRAAAIRDMGHRHVTFSPKVRILEVWDSVQGSGRVKAQALVPSRPQQDHLKKF